jgi:acetylornithine deacetylase/succinyl-diaminopimelate desuccinylase-like protein
MWSEHGKKSHTAWMMFLILLICTSTVVAQEAQAPQVTNERLLQLLQWGKTRRTQLVQELARLVQLPSVAVDPQGLQRTASTLRAMLEQRGFAVQDFATAGPPLLFASAPAPHAKETILFYLHYDGANVDSTQWKACAPFEPALYTGPLSQSQMRPVTEENLEESTEEWRLCGRGAADDKAPIVALLAVLEGINALTLNPSAVAVKILIDGEEESGSVHLEDALADPAKRRLLASDFVVILDTPQFQTRAPTLVSGVRGVVLLDLTVYGSTSDLHSGHYGNWAPNPAQELAWVLTQLKNPFSGRVQIEGFYDCRLPLNDADTEALRAIPNLEKTLRSEMGLSRIEGEALLWESLTYPSLNVRGLVAGATGATARTIIPARAEAAIDIRLVKDCSPEYMVSRLQSQLEQLGYHVIAEDPSDTIRAKFQRIVKLVRRPGGYEAGRTPLDSPIIQRLTHLIAMVTGVQPVRIPTMGGSVPFAVFAKHLNVPVVVLPLVNHDNNQHGPDENLRLGDFWRGFDILAALVMTSDESPR